MQMSSAYQKRIEAMAKKEHEYWINYYKTKFKKTSKKVPLGKRNVVAYIGPGGKTYVKSFGRLVIYKKVTPK